MRKHIIEISHQCYGVSNKRQFDSLFNRLLRSTAKETSPALLVLCERNSLIDSPQKGPVMRKKLPCHDFPWDTCWRDLRWSTSVTGEFVAQRPVTRSLVFSSICAWINGRVNSREAGDLRRHRAHYDVTAMNCDTRDFARSRRPFLNYVIQ